MKYMLYYSNYCEHSKRILLQLAKDTDNTTNKEISYICIDKRKKLDDGIYAQLENGRMIKLPPNLKEVPSLVMLNRGNSILVGEKILNNFQKPQQQVMKEDPSAFSMGEMSGLSDAYSYLDMSTTDLSAKGEGGMRMMHGYVGLDHVDKIETPPEEEESNKSLSTEEIMKKRGEEINLNT